MALRRPRTERSYPTPITNFDDRNRERYIARSGGIGSIAPNPMAGTIVDYALGKGGRMAPSYDAPIGGVLQRDLMIPEVEKVPEYRETLDESLTPVTSYIDPTADDYFLRELYNKFFNPIDPENEGLPMDEFQELPDDFKGFLPPGSMTETLEADADTYTLPNLLQMLNDARDAGNVDEIELLTNDLEMLYPGATMDVAELTDAQKDFMLSPLQNPAFQSTGDLFNKVKQMEDKGFFGFGAQEPTTMEEMLEFMNTDAYRRAFS